MYMIVQFSFYVNFP